MSTTTNPTSRPGDHEMGRATVAACHQSEGYTTVRLALGDGRNVWFVRPSADLRDAAGRVLAPGDEVMLLGDYLLPKAVSFGGRVLFRSADWWSGPPPA